MPSEVKPCFLPYEANIEIFRKEVIKTPQVLTCGVPSTGPLARSLFILVYTEEQALVVKLKNKDLIVFTGCGHPTIEVILKMVNKISTDPIYAIGGGLHFPIDEGRVSKAGIQLQTIFGTGKPPWKKSTFLLMIALISHLNTSKAS